MSDAVSNVLSPWGCLPPERIVIKELVDGLEKMLEKARAGEIVGAVLVSGHHDQTSSFSILGAVGTYSLVGAMTIAARNLEHITNSE
jgi:hypothetical protein